MNRTQIAAAKEAIGVLHLAHEYFDQACALLKDANLHTSGLALPLGMHHYDAQGMNEKLIPKLIEYLNDCPECCHPLTGHHPQHGCEHGFTGPNGTLCGCKGEKS